MKEDADRLTRAVRQVLKNGYRTTDIAGPTTDRQRILGTKEMGEKVIEHLKQSSFAGSPIWVNGELNMQA